MDNSRNFAGAKFGARGAIVEEPLVWSEIYPIQWREPRINLAELAKLRWIEGWSRTQLAEHYGKSVDAIQNYFQEAKRLRLKPEGILLANRD